MMQRLKEVFKKTSSEFRDCVYNLLGYKVDRLQNKGGLFRLSSMYAESPNDYLLFKVSALLSRVLWTLHHYSLLTLCSLF